MTYEMRIDIIKGNPPWYWVTPDGDSEKSIAVPAEDVGYAVQELFDKKRGIS